jgi:hypothetical protein
MLLFARVQPCAVRLSIGDPVLAAKVAVATFHSCPFQGQARCQIHSCKVRMEEGWGGLMGSWCFQQSRAMQGT